MLGPLFCVSARISGLLVSSALSLWNKNQKEKPENLALCTFSILTLWNFTTKSFLKCVYCFTSLTSPLDCKLPDNSDFEYCILWYIEVTIIVLALKIPKSIFVDGRVNKWLNKISFLEISDHLLMCVPALYLYRQFPTCLHPLHTNKWSLKLPSWGNWWLLNYWLNNVLPLLYSYLLSMFSAYTTILIILEYNQWKKLYPS